MVRRMHRVVAFACLASVACGGSVVGPLGQPADEDATTAVEQDDASSSGDSEDRPPPSAEGDSGGPPPPNPGRTIHVATSEELTAAMADARPGDSIHLADGRYTGRARVGSYTGSFVATVAGTEALPIVLTGSRSAILDGGGTGGHYGLYLVGAHHWRLVGFAVSEASKGIMLDGSTHVRIERVEVSEVGQEAIHFRAFSTDGLVQDCDIHGTGRTSPQFGEGVYIGSASSNWDTYSDGRPDASDRVQVIGSRFFDFSAEAIDIKEGTRDGVVSGNHFDGSALSGENFADSWIDVKGDSYLITGNVGESTLLDGYQVHNTYEDWGRENVFAGNHADVGASGFGFNVAGRARDFENVVRCDNTVADAGEGLSNIPCTP